MLALVSIMRTIRPSDWGYHLYNRQGGHIMLPIDRTDYLKGSAAAMDEARNHIRLSIYLDWRAHGHTHEEALIRADDMANRFDTWRKHAGT